MSESKHQANVHSELFEGVFCSEIHSPDIGVPQKLSTPIVASTKDQSRVPVQPRLGCFGDLTYQHEKGDQVRPCRLLPALRSLQDIGSFRFVTLAR